jgi:hypothetical protein
MPIEGRGDELDLFAGTVNRMIGEVERTVDQVKSVTDAIAHDLRTPLTRVRNQLYRASRDPDMAPADVVRIEAAMADLDLVLARFAALLRISELEASGRRQGFATSRIDRLLDAVVELYGPLAEERDVALRWDGAEPVRLYCDEKLIFEAVSNLVDNAIKFAPEGGRVSIGLAKDNGFVAIEVCDNGPVFRWTSCRPCCGAMIGAWRPRLFPDRGWASAWWPRSCICTTSRWSFCRRNRACARASSRLWKRNRQGEIHFTGARAAPARLKRRPAAHATGDHGKLWRSRNQPPLPALVARARFAELPCCNWSSLP